MNIAAVIIQGRRLTRALEIPRTTLDPPMIAAAIAFPFHERPAQMTKTKKNKKNKTARFVTHTTFSRPPSGEYRVKAYDQYGNRFKAADYFTDDSNDARLTAAVMIKEGAEKLQRHNEKVAEELIDLAAKGLDGSPVMGGPGTDKKDDLLDRDTEVVVTARVVDNEGDFVFARLMGVVEKDEGSMIKVRLHGAIDGSGSLKCFPENIQRADE